jgi:transposase
MAKNPADDVLFEVGGEDEPPLAKAPAGRSKVFRHYDPTQSFLLPPSLDDWLPEDHLVWFVLDIVTMVDLAAFHKRHPNDGVGRRAYDPEMMLALLVYAYCTGTRSSRRIAAGCRTDLAMKVIWRDVVPEHDAIGRFRANHEQAIKGAFTDVLMLCARIGLTSLGIVAIDGTKIGSDAALDANRSESAILAEVERILAEAKASDELDATQPALAGNVPEVPVRPAGRLARLQAALGEIRTERETRRKQEEARVARVVDDAP